MNIIKAIKLSMLIVLAPMCMASSCENKNDEHKYITLINKSVNNIACQMLWQGTISEADSLFDCSLVTNYFVSKDSSYLIKNGSHSGGWETDFTVIPYLQLLIMDGELFKQYSLAPCDTIRKYVPILYRYQLKLEDLQRMNWTVVFPPEE